MDWERRHFVEKDISFRFPVSKFEKIKYDEDETLPYEKRRPSIWRDWQELRELMEGVRPSTSDSSGEGLSRPLRPSSDIKIVHRFSFNWSDQKNLEEIFRKNVVLLLDHSGPQTWDRTHVEELLQLRAETQVPVHVLNQRTLEDPICVSSTSIRDVIDEGLSPNHRALNVLSIPLTSPSSVSTIEKLLDSDTTSWNSTVTHPEALMPSVPPKTKWWGMVTLSGCIHSPHIDASGLCTAIHVAVGYKFFIVATDSASFSLVGLRKKDQSIEECVRRAKWRVVVIPPGGTLFLPAGTMHYAFTPETTCGAPPGAIARGSHFYSWSRLPDTLRALWRLRLTKDAITNAEHAEMFTLLSRMLIDVSNRVETGSADLPAPEDIGALLTIIHQRVDLGYDTRLSPLHTAAVELSSLRADILIAKFKADMPEIFEAWKKEQARLSHWIHDCTDLIPGELSKLQSLNQ
ncbi:hypothetical protein BS47DRAFT_534626 [Hydnum rufescens UP504]|uniref:JmjC domain-containing protein n=1 Tax=Hydnum rufescens UP504 TaxID=1448309 RepID=A0A9P6AGU0_9AGAM|nr:hypothetical protein BS47DRAFT_534626 [Hydnum rufescens UP504]